MTSFAPRPLRRYRRRTLVCLAMPEMMKAGFSIPSADLLLAHPDDAVLRSLAERLRSCSGLDVWTTPLADEAIDVATQFPIGAAIIHRDIGAAFDWRFADVLRRLREAFANHSRGRRSHDEPIVHVPMAGLQECAVISHQRLRVV